MSPAVEEILYPALEDYEVDIVIGQGPSARTVKVRLERFTLIGATTRTGLLTSPLRSRFGIVAPARVLHAGRSRGDRPAIGEDSRTCRSTTRRRPRLRAARAARRASPTGCCGACATTRRCAPSGTITLEVRARRPEAARGRRARVRRGRSQAAADDHRQVRRRAGRPEHDRGGDQRGEGRDRRHLRAVPDPDRLPRSHAARPRRDAAGLRLFRARRARRTRRDSRLW